MNDNEKELDNTNGANDEKEIDLVEIAKTLWARRKMILKWCGIGALIGLVIAFSIPKEYTTEVTLAPEALDEKGSSKSMGALASLAGVNLNGAAGDAVSPQIYPDILKSVPFCLSLLDIPLTDIDGENKFTLEEYLDDYTSSPWWSAITGAPRALISLIMPKKEEVEIPGDAPALPIRITQDQADMIEALNKRITASIDEKTFIVTISVQMQDPLVSAVVADTVANRLKEYVTEYRTNKARQDMYYIEKLNEEAREKYYAAQQRYANYLDTHQGIVLHSAQTMRDRLENEATLAFNVFNQTSGQLQMAKAKVQEVTPVYATIEPPTVPVKPSAPRKVLILAGFIFLSFVAACAWILFIKPLKTQFKGDPKPEEPAKKEQPEEDKD